MKKPLFLLALIGLLVSCKESRLSINVREMDFVNKSDVTVQGTQVDAEQLLSVKSIGVCDSFLIVQTYDNEAQMYVYSDDYRLLGRFCSIGRAKNEFLEGPIWFGKQIFRDADGNALLPLVDTGQGTRLMDLQKSLETQSTVIVGQNEFTSGEIFFAEMNGRRRIIVGSFKSVFLDNDINHVFEDYQPLIVDDVVFCEPHYAVFHDTAQVKEIRIFSKFDQYDYKYINGSLFKHPERNLIVQPLTDMDYIFFFDLDKDKTFAIHQSGSPTFDDEIPAEIGNENTLANGEKIYETKEDPHFAGGLAYAKSFFMVTYYAGYYDSDGADTSNGACELMFFDWDGKFLKSVKLDHFVTNITYDERKHILYGINNGDRIISFNLSPVVADIVNN